MMKRGDLSDPLNHTNVHRILTIAQLTSKNCVLFYIVHSVPIHGVKKEKFGSFWRIYDTFK
jgi:hypothetical protein